MILFKAYKRPWHPMKGLEDSFPHKPDGTLEDVYIMIVMNCVVHGDSYWICLRRLPMTLKMNFYCWLVNKKWISRERFRRWCKLDERSES